MAIIDAKLILSTDQQVTTAGGAEITDNVIDLGAEASGLVTGMGKLQQIGDGTPLYVYVYQGDVNTRGTTPTVKFELMTHTTATVTSGSVLAVSDTISIASTSDGDLLFKLPLPVVGPVEYERYLGGRITVAGTSADHDFNVFIATEQGGFLP